MVNETNFLDNELSNNAEALVMGFKTMLARYLAENGSPTNGLDSFYSWKDYEMSKHFMTYDGNQACKITSVTEVVEVEWDEFVDTFYEGDTTHYGIEGEAKCACGVFSGKFRAEGNIVEIIPAMLKILTQI